MRIEFNIRKSHFFVILGLLLVVGFGIAQTPPNPGHSASQVDMGSGLNLNQWGNNIQTGINNHDTAITNLQSGMWTPISPVQAGPLCWPNAGGVCSATTIQTSIPTAFIPVTAKQVLVYVWVNKCPSGTTANPAHFSIYTMEGSTKYIQKLVVNDHNTAACRFNSDNLWLPVTSDYRVYVDLSASVTSVASGIEFLGYR